jgi:hypothetical protein
MKQEQPGHLLANVRSVGDFRWRRRNLWFLFLTRHQQTLAETIGLATSPPASYMQMRPWKVEAACSHSLNKTLRRALH